MVVDPDAAQPQVARNLFPGRVPGPIALVDPQSRWGRPEAGTGEEADLLRVRFRADARAAAAFRIWYRPIAGRAEPGECGARSRLVTAGARLDRKSVLQGMSVFGR